jgi:hypothetical protein
MIGGIWFSWIIITFSNISSVLLIEFELVLLSNSSIFIDLILVTHISIFIEIIVFTGFSVPVFFLIQIFHKG